MAKNILVVLVHTRASSAVQVQKVLTEYGCIIKTRLGIHDGVADLCSNEGLIILELAGDKKEMAALDKALSRIAGVKTKAVRLAL